MDKHAYQVAAGNYAMARIKHWTHLASNTTMTGDTVESIKYPLENRIWFAYPGQPGGGYKMAASGSFDQPAEIARVLDDGTTQLTKFQYNAAGNLTTANDPVGRRTMFSHAPNQIDLMAVSHRTGSSNSIIAQFTYNSQHLPLTYTDAAGQTTSYAYNAAGQLIRITDPLGEVTTYQYDPLGYLTSIINANGATPGELQLRRLWARRDEHRFGRLDGRLLL